MSYSQKCCKRISILWIDSYIKPDTKMFFINDTSEDDEYFSSYSQNKILLGIFLIISCGKKIGLYYLYL